MKKRCAVPMALGLMWCAALGCGSKGGLSDGGGDAAGDSAVTGGGGATGGDASVEDAARLDGAADTDGNIRGDATVAGDAIGDRDASGDATDAGDVADAVDGDGAADACVPMPEGVTVSGLQATFTCPTTAIAVAGDVATTCEFPRALASTKPYTGTVTLVSHLARDFADFDINSIGDGRIQLMCVYDDADGNGVGGLFMFVYASKCMAVSAAAFTCTK